MADVNDGDIIIIVGTVIILGQVTENAYAFRAHTGGGGATKAECLAAAQQMMLAVYDPIHGQMTSAATFWQIEVRNKTQGVDFGDVSWLTSWTDPLSASDMLPTGVAALVAFVTTSAGTKGRKYVMGMVEGNTTNGSWKAATMTALSDMAIVLLQRINFTPVSGCYLEYVVVKEGVGSFTAYDPISALISGVPAYQRRRKVGVGI